MDLHGIIQSVGNWVWGPPMIVLLLGTGVYLTFLLGGVQFRLLGHALWLALIKRKEDSPAEGDISHFQALMTALSATVGTGNIAGVATAIAAGGPGALFWMWMTGLVGMATKYAEAVLAVKYRVQDEMGTMSGGPMYYLSRGLGLPWLGALFAFFAAFAAFGIGNMVQSNSVADALHSAFGVPFGITGAILALLTGLVILGGIRSIARVTEVLVPFMIVLYMVAGTLVLLLHLDRLPEAFSAILRGAFQPTAAVGGFLGATVAQTLRYGVARGIFSNESGLGSSPIAAAAAQTRDPVRQALVSMTQTFIDTLVVCTFTGLVILTTGVWTTGETGAALTAQAFGKGLPALGEMVVAVSLALFAYSTLLGWSYYGEKALEYLLGVRAVVPYRLVFSVLVLVGALVRLDTVWALADVMNGLMAVPNLVGLLGLSGVVAAETRRYLIARKRGGVS
jgi:AGCS family alanine or glycine:cation symporter